MNRSRSGSSGRLGSMRSTLKYSVTRMSVAEKSPPMCPSFAPYTISRSRRRTAVASWRSLATCLRSIIVSFILTITFHPYCSRQDVIHRVLHPGDCRWLSLMLVGLPAQVGLEGFFEHIGHVCARHRDVMLEALLTDVVHQLLQARHLDHRVCAERVQRVVGEAALAHIGFDTPFSVVGAD